MTDTNHLYLIALGSNQRDTLLGPPGRILRHVFAALEMEDISVFAESSIVSSRPVGPSRRQFANATAIIQSPLNPPRLLARLQTLEAHFGRRKNGQKWRERVLDLDIMLWSGGIWSGANPALCVPHPEMHKRAFVLQPANEIAPDWYDPISNLQIKQLAHRINRPKPLDP